jgi:hypothetical protein
MPRNSNYRTLINRGRKAGLTTGEIYSAMATRPTEGTDLSQGELDGNGFVTSYDAKGRRVIQPVDKESRS